MHCIFISYRRSEAAFAAGALGRELRQYFGEAQVFRDREDVEGGASWRAQVLSAIDHDCALLVLIDDHWLDPVQGQDRSRLVDPNDPVRLEILDALHDGATIIPLLLEGVEMPTASALPPELQQICELNALTLRDADWRSDVMRLCTTLEHLGFNPARRRHYGLTRGGSKRGDTIGPVAVAYPAPPRGRSAQRALLYLFAAAALATVAWLLGARFKAVPHTPAAGLTAATAGSAPQPQAAAQFPAGSSARNVVDASVAEPSQPSQDTVAEPIKPRTRSVLKPKELPPSKPAPTKTAPNEPSERRAPQTRPANPLDMEFQ